MMTGVHSSLLILCTSCDATSPESLHFFLRIRSRRRLACRNPGTETASIHHALSQTDARNSLSHGSFYESALNASGTVELSGSENDLRILSKTMISNIENELLM